MLNASHHWVRVGGISESQTKKKRSLESNEIEEYGHPFMKRISELGFDKLWMDAECQKQLLCQMTHKGTEDNANNVQKSLNFVAKM